MNFKIRFKNKVWLGTFVMAVVAFLYTVAGMFEWVPPISQDMAMQLVSIILTFLTGLGVLIDPTTPGAGDSNVTLKKNNINETAEYVVKKVKAEAEEVELYNYIKNRKGEL